MRICLKMTLGFALVVIVVVLTAIFSMRTIWDIGQERLSLRSEVMPNVQQTMHFYEAMVDMDHWIATYLLNGDADALAEAQRAFDAIQTVCNDLQDDLGWPDANSTQALIASVDKYIATIKDMAELRKSGANTYQIIEQQGRNYHDHMNHMLRELGLHRQVMLARIKIIQEHLSEEGRRGWWTVILATAAVVLLAASIGVFSIRQLNREITRRQQTEEALETARVQADAANRAKTQFLANVSHEIRTPLNAIITLARLLNKRDTKNLTDQQHEALAVMQGSSQQLLALINGVLDITKIESGRTEITLTRTTLAPLLDSVQHLGQTLIQDKPIAIRVDQAPGLPETIVTDAPKLQMILTNVMANAVKFTDQGEIVLGAAWSPDQWTFEVTDTGIGIAPEHIDRIFEDFTQVDGSTTRRYGGTGLGLAITKGLTELLDGHVVATSTLGQGTKITISLPHQSNAVVADVEEKTTFVPASDAIKSVKVLVAEDDEYGRAALELMLADRCLLQLAVNGRDAVDQYRIHSPDIVFLDIMMPEMDGYQAFTEIRKHSPRVPIIVLTAKALADDREKLLAFGFSDYLAKPIDEDKLMSMISRYATLET
jgi:signal transduction histidine kinase